MIDKINKIKEISSLYNSKKFHETIKESKKFLSNDDNWSIRNIYSVSLMAINSDNEAIKSFKEAINVYPDIPDLYNNLGAVYKKIGKNKLALKNYEKAIELKNDYKDANLNIANVYLELGEAQKAIKIYEKIIKKNNNDHISLYNLGVAYININENEKALSIFQKSIKILPTVHAYNNIGLIFLKKNMIKEALKSFNEAIKVDKKILQPYLNIHKILLDHNRNKEALSFTRKLNKEFPNNYMAQFCHSLSLENNNLLKDAIESYKKTISLNANHRNSYNNLASVYSKIRQTDTALKIFETIKNKGLYNNDIAYNHANLLTKLGDKDKAYKIAIDFIKKEPSYPKMYNILALTKGIENNKKELETLFDAYNKMEDISEDKIFLGFNIASILDRKDNFKLAAQYIIDSNKNKSEKLFYDINKLVTQHKEIKNLFTKEYISKYVNYGNKNNKAIFVLGMPRSGSSLIEQILSTHSQVEGLGELKDMTFSINNSSKKFTELKEVDPSYYEKIGNDYIQSVERNYNPANIFVDKALMFSSIGFIKLALPNSKIILCKRNPKDHKLSIYKNYFLEAGHAYSYDARDLKKYYQEYENLTDHWHEMFGNGILEISYEKLVMDTKVNIEKILNFCNLDWEENCMNFHENKRYVDTISASSVKEPIYKRSINSWEKYENYFKDLF